MKYASSFKEFLLRGNIVDLAVAVVIGVAFGARLHHQQEYVHVRPFSKSGHFIRNDRRGDILLCRVAGQRTDRPLPQGRAERSDRAQVPGVPE